MENDLLTYIYTKYIDSAENLLLFTIEDWIEEEKERIGNHSLGGYINISVPKPPKLITKIRDNITIQCSKLTDPDKKYKFLGSYDLSNYGGWNRCQINVERFTEINSKELVEYLISRVKAEILGMIGMTVDLPANRGFTYSDFVVVFEDIGGKEVLSSTTYDSRDLYFLIEVDSIYNKDIGDVIFHLSYFPLGKIKFYGKQI